MIGTIAVIRGREGTGDQLEAALRDLAGATHAEDGCVLYSVQRGIADRDTFVTVEKWRDQADLDAHLASDHVRAAMGAATPLLAADLDIIPTAQVDAGDPTKNSY